MRIMLVTYRYGKNIAGGGERYLRELMIRLTRKGHEVEVFTTRSQHMILTPFNYLVWDNFLPAGRESDEGVTINRFEVHNPKPRKGFRMTEDFQAMQERERESQEFSSLMSGAVEGLREHCFLSGWHEHEVWKDGPARWTRRTARLVVGGEDITSLSLDAYSYLNGQLMIEVPGKGSWEFELEKGKRRELRMDFAPCASVAVTLTVPHAGQPLEDAREVGVVVRRVMVGENGGGRELDLGRGWKEFLDTAPESTLGRVLWGMAEIRPERTSQWHRYLMGPRSPQLEREAMAAAGDFDIVFGSMIPMASMDLAWRAARDAGKPFVAFPFFHTRDPNHYWGHFQRALKGASGVEANSRAISELMRGWGLNAFGIGPGFDLQEFTSPSIDGQRFRNKYKIGDRPMLLWVGRKHVYKGYPEAIGALQVVRENGSPAVLVMIGPDEDNLPVSGEGVFYLGAQPREELLDAFDACNVFLSPSLHESFGLVFGEAWLRGKPVLGNTYCAATRGLIDDGKDGYLCADIEDYGRRALELITDPGLAGKMGETGRDKILATRDWDALIDELEKKLEEMSAY